MLGDSPRAARYAGMRTRRKILAVMAISGGIAGLGGASQVGDFRAHARRRPERAAEAVLRLHGDRRRGARALQPVRGPARRVPDRRPPERGQHAAGRRLPVGPRRRDPGADPLLGARRRAARPLPDPLRPPAAGRRRGARRVNNSLLVVVLALRRRVRHAAPLRVARRAARRALGRAQPRRRGDDARRRRDRVLDGAAVHATSAVSLAVGVVVGGARGRGDRGDPRVPRDHAAREPDRLRPRDHDLRGRGRALVVPRQRPEPRRQSPARHQFQPVFPASVQDWPVVGPIVFGQNVLVYVSWLCVVAVWLYLWRTRPGLNVRAVGESPAAADAMGIHVGGYRYAHTLAGGALAGVAGATFTLALTPQWSRRDHGRRGLDRDRARDLRVLAAGALPRRRVLLRRRCRRSRRSSRPATSTSARPCSGRTRSRT